MVEDMGDYTTGEIIRRTLKVVEEHAHHFEHYLEDDSLAADVAVEEADLA
jgi:bacterioferritin (cytochrome b1)